MRIRVRPTDARWFRFLRVGGYNRMRVSEAWLFFGEGNGVGSSDALTATINAWRVRNKRAPESDPVIGCLLLDSVFFVVDQASLAPPRDFPGEAVRGKGYSPGDLGYDEVEAAFVDLFWRSGVAARHPEADDLTSRITGDTRGDPRLVVPRVGQQAFKGLVLTGYERRCVISGSRIRPALEAAHIRPVAQQGEHRLDNGLLLRADIHTMYDAGYLGVDPDYRLRVSPRLRRDFGNGAEFYSREGELLSDFPRRQADRPHRDFLAWHMDEVFR